MNYSEPPNVVIMIRRRASLRLKRTRLSMKIYQEMQLEEGTLKLELNLKGSSPPHKKLLQQFNSVEYLFRYWNYENTTHVMIIHVNQLCFSLSKPELRQPQNCWWTLHSSAATTKSKDVGTSVVGGGFIFLANGKPTTTNFLSPAIGYQYSASQYNNVYLAVPDTTTDLGHTVLTSSSGGHTKESSF